jgi:hypothetical protein
MSPERDSRLIGSVGLSRVIIAVLLCKGVACQA